MAHYMIQASYTSEGWATLVKNPQDRAEALRPIVEGLSGKLTSTFFTFGDYDLVFLLEMPDNVSAAALSIAAAAGGSVKNVRTTPLMTIEEGIDAMRKAAASGYQPAS